MAPHDAPLMLSPVAVSTAPGTETDDPKLTHPSLSSVSSLCIVEEDVRA